MFLQTLLRTCPGITKPCSLQRAVFYYIGKRYCFVGGEKQRLWDLRYIALNLDIASEVVLLFIQCLRGTFKVCHHHDTNKNKC